MSGKARWIRPLLTLLLAAASALGLLNVYSGGDVVEALARQTACEGPACVARTTRIQRTPFSHEYRFAVGSGAEVDVRCQRALVLLGEWSCQRPGAP